jgi:hypothetical protein
MKVISKAQLVNVKLENQVITDADGLIIKSTVTCDVFSRYNWNNRSPYEILHAVLRQMHNEGKINDKHQLFEIAWNRF